MDFLEDLANMANKPKIMAPMQMDLPSEIHQLLMEIKISHYKAKPNDFEHQALGDAYDKLNDLADEIVEKLMGYCQKRVYEIQLMKACACSGYECSNKIIDLGEKIISYGETNKYRDIVNLGDTFSGVGAQLRYLMMP